MFICPIHSFSSCCCVLICDTVTIHFFTFFLSHLGYSYFLLVLVFFIQLICPVSRSLLKHLLSKSFRHLSYLQCVPNICSWAEDMEACFESHTLVCSTIFSSWQLHGHVLNTLGGVKIWVHTTSAHYWVPTVRNSGTADSQGQPGTHVV